MRKWNLKSERPPVSEYFSNNPVMLLIMPLDYVVVTRHWEDLDNQMNWLRSLCSLQIIKEVLRRDRSTVQLVEVVYHKLTLKSHLK